MLKELHLTGVGPAPTFDLNFAERLNVFTGDNGVGKSFILDVAWHALTGTWPREPYRTKEGGEGTREVPAWPTRGWQKRATIGWVMKGKNGRLSRRDTRFAPREGQWTWPTGRPPMPGLTVYARVDGSFSVWDPARNYWRESETLRVADPGRADAFHFSPYTLWNGLEDEDGTMICRGLIEDWQTWQLRESASKRSPFAILRKVLMQLSPPGEGALEPGEPARVGPDVREIPTLRQPNGDVPITFVSAGMKRILGLSYLLIWAWHEHRRAKEELGQPAETRFVLLFDEIETHLHPKWQRRIIRSLLEVITGLGDDELTVQVLLTTHSPLVLAALEPTFEEEEDKLFHLYFKGEGVQLEHRMD